MKNFIRVMATIVGFVVGGLIASIQSSYPAGSPVYLSGTRMASFANPGVVVRTEDQPFVLWNDAGDQYEINQAGTRISDASGYWQVSSEVSFVADSDSATELGLIGKIANALGGALIGLLLSILFTMEKL